MRLVIIASLVLAVTGCAQHQSAEQRTVKSATSERGTENVNLPLCNASAWQLDGLVWFDSSEPVNDQPTQAIFDSAGRKCLMRFD